MRRRNTSLYHIMILVFAQIAWMGVLGIWIYWYVSNYILFERAWDELSTKVSIDGINTLAFVGGLILLVGVWFAMTLTFRRLSVQLKMNSLYDNFIANVTHELKSPLSSIQLYLETMNTRDISIEKRKEFVGRMLEDTSRLNNLINSILEIPRLEQKKVSHHFHVYNMDKLVGEVIKETSNLYKLSPDKITIEGLANVNCVVDENAFRILVNNLVDNAIKYSGTELKITVKKSVQLKRFNLEFTDNGIGITKKEQKNIFNKFYRINDRSIPSVKGTGLGLYWVKEIVRSHGGNISVFSEGRNKGTTFIIELPVYDVSKKGFGKRLLKLTRKQAIKEEVEDEG